ncbi:hypothetical protein [Rhodococcus aetherivorans]|uniref:hypothetical protein n=1 Tax=Rhodococcus aetherivorans TaxID=191292 RepID=UPI00163B4728|nr:hypothetical protein [Rhodococcus aetherivorans]MBC2592404.1 hypothetical protein [Rhodococcus aetherivorans]
MNKIRTFVTVVCVGAFVVVGAGVAAANPPGIDPLAGVPGPLRPLAAAVMDFVGNVWNMFADLANWVLFGSS